MFSLFSNKRRKQQTEPPDEIMVLRINNGPGTYSVDVVGESHYQEALEDICGGRNDEGQRFETEAFLVHEDDNPYDDKAVRIAIEGETVGYLDRKTARDYRKDLAKIGYAGAPATCSARIVGGWDRGDGDRGHFGVKLDLPTG